MLPDDIRRFLDDTRRKHLDEGHSWAFNPFLPSERYCQFCGTICGCDGGFDREFGEPCGNCNQENPDA
jgi:hypothetical protein